MPSVSKKQQRFFGIIRAIKKGVFKGEKTPEIQRVASSISDKDSKKMASTKHKGLPEKVKEELNTDDKPFVKKLVGKLRKGSKTHAKQADDLEKAMKTEAVEYPHMMYDPKTGNEVKAKTPADHNKYAKMGYTHEKPKTDEALNLQQRMKRSRLMKRLKTRIKIGRARARRKMANKKTLEKRAMRQARAAIAKKLTRGIPKAELTFARKQEIEKRLDKPALKNRIKRIAKRIFKDVRKKEVQRKKG